MILFLPKNIWENKRGFRFRKPCSYLPPLDYHPGQDFFTLPVGKVPILAPSDGSLTTFRFSKSAGWWGFYEFNHRNETYCLKILHMYKEMKEGDYKEGDILGYCGATGYSITQRNGASYIGPSHEEQTSDKAVPHLHVELHKGEFKHDTNKNKILADKRIIDPVNTFEEWIKEKPQLKQLIFYREEGKSSLYIKGSGNIYYPILMGKHFKSLFGDFNDNKIKDIKEVNPKSDSYFGLFKSDKKGKYDAT